MRLDQYVVKLGLSPTRAKAQDAILEGRVWVNGTLIKKNSYQVQEEDTIHLKQQALPLVSRAGYKLYDVLSDFAICLQSRICLDVGASTGGFSDVCLREGARLVYAVDVGHDQLASSLLQEPRIINMEGINARYIEPSLFDPQPDFICMDVSFISIKQILPALATFIRVRDYVILIKPQFEAGRLFVHHGIVKDEKVQLQVIKDILHFATTLGLYAHHVQASSLFGRDGNKEFVVHLRKDVCTTSFPLKQMVREYNGKR